MANYSSKCEPILAGNSDPKGEIQSSLAEYSHNFRGIGKLKNHQIKLHVNTEVKPVATAPALFHTTSKNKYLNLYKK